jgi:hypothetical protein
MGFLYLALFSLGQLYPRLIEDMFVNRPQSIFSHLQEFSPLDSKCQGEKFLLPCFDPNESKQL